MDIHSIVGEEVKSGNLLFSLLLTVITFWIAKKKGFFHLPQSEKKGPEKSGPEKKGTDQIPVTFPYVLGVFSLFLFFAFFFLPLVFAIVMMFVKRGVHSNALIWEWVGHSDFSADFIWCSMAFLFLIPSRVRHYIFWGEVGANSRRFWKGCGMGVLAWIVSWPFILCVSIVASWISLKLWGSEKVEQEAVHRLKMTIGDSRLFPLMVIAVSLLVPFMEEILFRGFLQNFLKRRLGRVWAIGLTAFLFALAHFTRSQGYSNVQLIASLFTFALFLGFIYERERTIWASVALHASFNSFTILVIIINAMH